MADDERLADQAADQAADRASDRATELLPEEQAAGSDDPQAQAEAILAESDERTERPEAEEHRTSDEVAVDPD